MPHFGTVPNAGNVSNVTARKKQKSDNSDAKKGEKCGLCGCNKKGGQTKVVCFSMGFEAKDTACRQQGNGYICHDVRADDKLPVRQAKGRETGCIAKAVSVSRNQSKTRQKPRRKQ